MASSSSARTRAESRSTPNSSRTFSIRARRVWRWTPRGYGPPPPTDRGVEVDAQRGCQRSAVRRVVGQQRCHVDRGEFAERGIRLGDAEQRAPGQGHGVPWRPSRTGGLPRRRAAVAARVMADDGPGTLSPPARAGVRGPAVQRAAAAPRPRRRHRAPTPPPTRPAAR